jgi:hypothetical protein
VSLPQTSANIHVRRRHGRRVREYRGHGRHGRPPTRQARCRRRLRRRRAAPLLFTRIGYRQQAEKVQPLWPLSEPLWPLARPPCSHARIRKIQEGLLLLQRRRATRESVGERSRQDLVPVSPVLRRCGEDVPPRLHAPGKLGSRRGVNSLGGLTYLTDSLSGTRFLVDTGAAVSVLPYTGTQSTSSAADGPSLAGADGTSIKSWGKIYKSVSFGGRLFTDVPFVQAAVNKPILGADFFSKHKLLVDTACNRVLDAAMLLPLGKPVGGKGTGLVAALSAVPPPVRSLLAEFPSVVGDGSDTPRPLHRVQHTVETKGRPLFAKSRWLDPDKLRTAEKEFRALEKAGIVRRSNSGWSSPLHVVPKADGSFRPCGDYRRLNTVTEDDRYPLPSIQDFTANLAGCTVFSKIDLVKGYHQVPMAESDIPKTAICTPFGLFEYIFMPFGLKNAAQTFQRLMDKLFRHLPFVFVYLDDILIASKDLSEHMRHLRLVFEILQSAGLQVYLQRLLPHLPRAQRGLLRHLSDGEAREGADRLPAAVRPKAAAAFFGPD